MPKISSASYSIHSFAKNDAELNNIDEQIIFMRFPYENLVILQTVK